MMKEHKANQHYLIIVAVMALLITVISLVILFIAPNFIYGKLEIPDLSVISSEVTPGDVATIVVSIENNGFFPITGSIPVTVDGTIIQTPEVYLYGKSKKDVLITLTGYKVGLHKVLAGELTDNFRVLKPASFQVYDLAVNPATPVIGQEMEVSVKVKNTGEIKGTYTANFSVYNQDQRPVKVTLEPGEVKTITKRLVTKIGYNPITIDNLSLSFKTVYPASIYVKELTLSKEYIKAKGESLLSVSLYNSGDLDGLFELVLMRNGKQHEILTVEVNGKSEKQVSFRISESKPGKYKYSVGKISTQLTVVTKSRPKNGTFLMGSQDCLDYNSLTIVNNYNMDAIIVIQKNHNYVYEKRDFRTVLIVYVRAKSSFTINNVPAREYRIFYSYGKDYSPERKGFMTNVTYALFDHYFTSDSIYTITLNPSGKGNAKTNILDESDFPG